MRGMVVGEGGRSSGVLLYRNNQLVREETVIVASHPTFTILNEKQI